MNYRTEMIEGLIHAISDIRPGRCVGNTTRQINDTIDLFFTLPKGQKHIGFKDHDVEEYGLIANTHFRKKLARRLEMESGCKVVTKLVSTSKIRQIAVGENYIKALNF